MKAQFLSNQERGKGKAGATHNFIRSKKGDSSFKAVPREAASLYIVS